MPRRAPYKPTLNATPEGLEQFFVANYIVAQKYEGQWLLAFGDLLGDDDLGEKRPPVHSLLMYVGPGGEAPKSSWRISLELNDQDNSRSDDQLESLELKCGELRIRTMPAAGFWSGRVSHLPRIDPFEPGRDPEPQRIRQLRVKLQWDETTQANVVRVLKRIKGTNWLHIEEISEKKGIRIRKE